MIDYCILIIIKSIMTPLVSLVITTKNEEKNVPNVMRSIEAQSYSNIETILVDNGSEDKTKELAKQLVAKVYNKGPERSAQRNYGMIEKSSGRYVMFIDCDMILTPKLIENCAKMMEGGKYVKARGFDESMSANTACWKLYHKSDAEEANRRARKATIGTLGYRMR